MGRATFFHAYPHEETYSPNLIDARPLKVTIIDGIS